MNSTQSIQRALPPTDWTFKKPSAFAILCYIIILISIAYRIDYIVEYNPIYHIFSDTQRHWEQGIDVLRADPMTMTDPILFQVYIAALAKLTLKYPPLIAFYTIVLACLTPWLWFRFLREIHPDKNTALAGWAIFSCLPSWISIYGYFMQETLFLPLLGAALWQTWRCKRKSTIASFCVMVSLWALAGLTRGIAIPMAAIACAWLWCIQPQKIRKAIYSLIILGVFLGPLAYRSYVFAGIISPHGIGQMNMLYAKSGKRTIHIHYERQGAKWYYIFQSPAAEAKALEPLSDWQSQREGDVHIFIDLDKGAEDWDRAAEQHALSLTKYFSLTSDNLLLLFFSESWPDSNRERLLGEINYQTRWFWLPFTCFVIILCGIARQRFSREILFPALLIGWFIVQGLLPIAVNEGRYRMPFYGLIIVQALLLVRSNKNKGHSKYLSSDNEGLIK